MSAGAIGWPLLLRRNTCVHHVVADTCTRRHGLGPALLQWLLAKGRHYGAVRLATLAAVIAGLPAGETAAGEAAPDTMAAPDEGATQRSANWRSGAQELWLVVQINHDGPAEPALIMRLQNGRLLARGEDIDGWRLPVPAEAQLSSRGEAFYALDRISGLTSIVDEARQALFLQVPPAVLLRTSLSGQMTRPSAVSATAPGAFFNYDLSTQSSPGQSRVGGVFELAFFNSRGLGVTSFLAGSETGAVRLQTTWTQDRPAQLASLRVGDAVTAAGAGGKPVRFGGVQWATNYAIQPGFVSFPLPGFAGEAALPSTIELLVGDALRMNDTIPPGPFSIANMPVLTGAGDVSIVVRDLLGREQIVTLPYYVSPRLLQAGLDDFSYEAGFIRENFGIESFGYSRFAAAATQRHGFSDAVTGEIHAEILQNQQTVGVGTTLLLSSFGMLNASVAASRDNALGMGQLLDLGFERKSSTLSFGGSIQLTSPHFVQLGLQPGTLPPRRLMQGFVNLATSNHGSVGLAYASQVYRDRPSVELLSASYNVAIAQFGYLSLSVARVSSERTSMQYYLTFTRPFEARTLASSSISHDSSGNQVVANVRRSLPPGDGYGYRIQAETGSVARAEAGVSFQNGAGTYSLDVEQSRGDTRLRGTVSGGVALLGGDVFLSRRIDQGFGVVQVPGYSGVHVYADNQVVAMTNANGNALLPRLRPYERNPIRLEQRDLPLDAEIDTLELNATPALRSGVVIAFPVRRARGALIAVALDDGQWLPAGAVVQVVGDSTEFPVGMNGQAYLTGLSPSNQLRIDWKNQFCEFAVAYPPTMDPLPDLGVYVCTGVKQ